MRSCNNYSLFKVRIYVFLIIVYARSFSHRTRASRRDWRMRLRRFAKFLSFVSIGELVISEREFFRADCVLSLVDTRFVRAGEQSSSRKGALTQNCILVLKSCKHVVMYT